MKKKSIVVVALAIVSTIVLVCGVGCASQSSVSQNGEQQANRAYMSQVNQVMTNLNENLDAFIDAVSKNDAVIMKTQAARALESLDALGAIEPPDALKDVHASYVAGAKSLREALTAYVDAYTSSDPSALSADTIASIQQKYTDGVNCLKDADKKASELPN